MENKRALFVTSFSPFSEEDGDSVVASAVISTLKTMNYSVEVVHFSRGKKKAGVRWEYLQKKNWQKASLFFSLKPFFVKKMQSEKFKEHIQKKIDTGNFSTIIFHGYPMAQYAHSFKNKDLIYLEDEDMKTIFRARFQTSRKFFQRFFFFLEFLKASWYQTFAFSAFSKVWLLNSRNTEAYSFAKSVKTATIPIIVATKRSAFSKKAKDLVFTGTLNWEENVRGLLWFLRKVWPKLRKQYPTMLFHVVGAKMTAEIKQQIQPDKRIVAHGFVSDLRTIYKKSAVAISPIFTNAGIKIKILTYLQYGLPVVAIKDSITGLPSKKGILTASRSSFSKKAETLLRSTSLRELTSAQGRKNIQRNHSKKVLRSFLKKQL